MSGGFSNEGLRRVTERLQPFVAAEEAVGLVTLLYRHGEVAQVNTLGWQDREAKIPMARDTVFRVASMTKPITSVAAMMLIEDGKMRLTDTVDKWLPELANPKVLRAPDSALDDVVPASRSITVLDLLTHRSGIPYNFTAGGPFGKTIAERLSDPLNPDLTPDEWMNILGELPLLYDPGLRWHYGLSTDVLGVLIGRVAGMPFPDFLAARIFEPLGMEDTGFWIPQEKIGRMAAVYGMDQTGNRPRDPIMPRTAPPKFAAGGGGAVSTADDYLKFGRFLLNRGKLGHVRLLSGRSVDLMATNWLSPEQRTIPFFGMDFWGGQGFGLGLSVVDDIARYSPRGTASKGSFGWPGAYGTWWQADPKEDMVAIYLVQNAANLRDVTFEMMELASKNRKETSSLVFQDAIYRAIDD